jgi:adenosylhomocysteine nucleosidase
MDASPIGLPAGTLAGIGLVYLPCRGEVVQWMKACADSLAYHCLTGVIATGDVFMTDPERKKHVADTFGAISCEMEGGSIGHVCYVNGTDFCILRAISDSTDENHSMEFATFMPLAVENSHRILMEVLK